MTHPPTKLDKIIAKPQPEFKQRGKERWYVGGRGIMMMTHSLTHSSAPKFKCRLLLIMRPLTGSCLTGDAPLHILAWGRYGVCQTHQIYVMIWRTGEPGWARPGDNRLPFTSNW